MLNDAGYDSESEAALQSGWRHQTGKIRKKRVKVDRYCKLNESFLVLIVRWENKLKPL